MDFLVDSTWPMDIGMPGQLYFDNDAAFYPYMFMGVPAVPQIPREHDAVVMGSEPVIQTFYEGPEKCDCCINWIEKQPVQPPEIELERYNRAAICVYRCKDHEKEAARIGGLIALRYNRIKVQSQLLMDLIRPTLKAAGAAVPDNGHAEFAHPFKDLYFSYGKLMRLSEYHQEHSDEFKLLRLLEEVMKSTFADLSASVTLFRSKGTINYECLWTLFPKGMIAYRKSYGTEMLLRVTGTERVGITVQNNMKENRGAKDRKINLGLRIWYEQIGFDGSNFGAKKSFIRINSFEEERKITSLDIFPVGFHPDKNLLRNFTERGRKILSLQSVVHCGYEGSAGFALKESKYAFVTGRVIVDPFHFYRTNADIVDPVEPFEDDVSPDGIFQGNQSVTIPGQRNAKDQSTKLPWIDFDLDKRPSPVEQEKIQHFFEDRPHLLMLVEPCIPGFSLKRNEWFNLHLSKLREIQWTHNPLDNLIFDSNTKKMLASFSKHHSTVSEPAAGPLAGKGQGLVVLLSGPSGTGKTLTAEVMAEEIRLPLYRVMAGQLGSSPYAIEVRLEEVLDLALEWNAVVLIDEADTFIRSRSTSDRVTSEIVSIFLRRLEYFQGIIFLTTNMPHDIDDAFRSRCRLHILYRNLKSASRRSIWELNFTKAGLRCAGPDYSPEAFDVIEGGRLNLILDEGTMRRLVSWQLSGREIQNVVQNVVLWCKTDNTHITYDRLKTAIQMTVPYAKEQDDDFNSDDSQESSEDERPRKRPRPNTSG